MNNPLPNENGIYLPQRGVKLPKIVHAIPADYPTEPGLAQTRHTCVVSAVIGVDGSVQSVTLENSHPSAFDSNAIQAVKGSSFSPGTLKGQAVPVQAQVWVVFHGEGKPALPAMEHGGAFLNPKPRSTLDPGYTNEARKTNVNGDVFVSFLVTEDGKTADVQLINRLGSGLDEQAINAIRRWSFDPATLDGEAVPDRVSTVMSFRRW